jgi:hypothetical protein
MDQVIEFIFPTDDEDNSTQPKAKRTRNERSKEFNRLAQKRYRDKKKTYIECLEKRVTDLEKQISELKVRLAYFDIVTTTTKAVSSKIS